MATRNNRSGAPWTFYCDRGIATLDVYIAGKRYRPSLGIPYNPGTASARDVRAIEAAAAKKYASLIAGRATAAGPAARIMTSHTLHELFSIWLTEAEKLWPKSYRTRISQLASVEGWAEEAPRFKGDKRAPIERLLDDGGPGQFAADRLGEVLRGTVLGEISNLYTFFAWAYRERHFASLPPRPKLPRGAQGKRTGPQRAEPVDITEAEALAMCAAMPEWTARGGGAVRGKENKNAIRVRDVFRLCWELALRPGIAQKLSVPEHYVRGQAYVWISRDIDKIGLERRIPLTKVAKEILERCAPAVGVIFGVHELTVQIKRAAKAVLPPEKALRFARYDFRHGRAVHSMEVTGDLLGTSRLLGHTQMTTTNRYVRTREAHTAKVIAALDADLARTQSGDTIESDRSAEATMQRNSSQQGSNKENPGEHHCSPGPRSLHLPPFRFGGIIQDDRVRAGLCASEQGLNCATSDSAQPADGQDRAPAVITNLQRSIVFTRALADMHDPFYSLVEALADEEADS